MANTPKAQGFWYVLTKKLADEL